jgi:hypothetical protein
VEDVLAGRARVPASRADRTPRLDPVGAVLSLAGLVFLTYGLIEAPERGWTSVAALGNPRGRRGAARRVHRVGAAP